MLEDFTSVFLLAIASILSITISLSLFWNYQIKHKIYLLFWGISIFVLSIFGMIVIYYDFTIMTERIVHIITTLIPLCLALGIVYAIWEDRTFVYFFALYEVMTFSLLVFVELIPIVDLRFSATLLTHVPAGLVIFFAPIIGIITNKIELTSVFLSIGAVFIGSIGLLFAFVSIGHPILNYDEILTILPIAYTFSAVFFTLGMILPNKWDFSLLPSSIHYSI